MSLQLFGLARLGRDAEIRHTPAGDAVCDLSLAFNVRVKNEKATTWVKGTLWGKRAEALAPHLTKGASMMVLVSDVAMETFSKADGTPATALVGRVMEIDLAGSPGERAAPPPPPPPPPKPKPTTGGFSDMDDDLIPF